MKKLYFAVIAAVVGVAPAQAFASPDIRWEKVGSSLIVYATNPQDRSWSCSGQVTATYDDYGTQKQSTTSVNFSVGPNGQNLRVFAWNTTWPGSTLQFSPSISCS